VGGIQKYFSEMKNVFETVKIGFTYMKVVQTESCPLFIQNGIRSCDFLLNARGIFCISEIHLFTLL
jgi:hypothetical protein